MLDDIIDGKGLNGFDYSVYPSIIEFNRIESYIDQIEKILKRLSCLISDYKKIQNIYYKESEYYTELINCIGMELQFLKATHIALEDYLFKVQGIDIIQYNISGKMSELKDRIYKKVKKAEKILKENLYSQG